MANLHSNTMNPDGSGVDSSTMHHLHPRLTNHYSLQGNLSTATQTTQWSNTPAKSSSPHHHMKKQLWPYIIAGIFGMLVGLALWPFFMTLLTYRILADFDHDVQPSGVDSEDPSYTHPPDDHPLGQSNPSQFSPKDVSGVKFDDICGVGEAKTELQEIVKFLKEPESFVKLGARMPRGVLLVGSPGTGKTMLAKAVANEAKVSFFYASGSDFIELYVGQGARRIRALFAQARQSAPSVVFIDEIDTIGGIRTPDGGGTGREHDQTLNALLVEMDGFSGRQDDGPLIMVLAATNRMQMLDKALLRPGRFDRITNVPLPDVRGRTEITLKYLLRLRMRSPKPTTEYNQSQNSDFAANTMDGSFPRMHNYDVNIVAGDIDAGVGDWIDSSHVENLFGNELTMIDINSQWNDYVDGFSRSDKDLNTDSEGIIDESASVHDLRGGKVPSPTTDMKQADKKAPLTDASSKKLLKQRHANQRLPPAFLVAIAKRMARLTPGFSGADIESMVNEAAILAAREGKAFVQYSDLLAARDKVAIGCERKGVCPSPTQRSHTAFHEAGHALIAFFLQPHTNIIHQATIVPRGSALGYVEQFPADDRYTHTQEELKSDMCVCMGGRAAEVLIFGKTMKTTGASSDLSHATRIAYLMAMRWGMSDTLGPMDYLQLRSMDSGGISPNSPSISDSYYPTGHNPNKVSDFIIRPHVNTNGFGNNDAQRDSLAHLSPSLPAATESANIFVHEITSDLDVHSNVHSNVHSSVFGTSGLSTETARLIEVEVRRMLVEAETDALKMLKKHRDRLNALAHALLEHETLSGEEITEILDPKGHFRDRLKQILEAKRQKYSLGEKRPRKLMEKKQAALEPKGLFVDDTAKGTSNESGASLDYVLKEKVDETPVTDTERDQNNEKSPKKNPETETLRNGKTPQKDQKGVSTSGDSTAFSPDTSPSDKFQNKPPGNSVHGDKDDGDEDDNDVNGAGVSPGFFGHIFRILFGYRKPASSSA